MAHSSRLLTLLCLGVLGACATRFSETGHLLRSEEGYEAVQNPADLFDGDVAQARAGSVRFNSQGLDIERNFLRYRIIVGQRYFTVHEASDPVARVAEGRYSVGIQPISVNSYVTGVQTVFGDPYWFDLAVFSSESLEVRLRHDGNGGVEAEVIRLVGG